MYRLVVMGSIIVATCFTFMVTRMKIQLDGELVKRLKALYESAQDIRVCSQIAAADCYLREQINGREPLRNADKHGGACRFLQRPQDLIRL